MKRPAAGLALLLLGIYLLTASAHFYAIDEVQMYGLAEAIGARGTLALNDPGPSEPPVYSPFGPGQSLVALPLFWLGGALGLAAPEEARPWLRAAVTLWLNPLLTAAVAALIYLGARRLAGHRGALLAGLAYGLGTTAWPHAQTFFAEPLNAALWLGAFLLLWRPGGPAPSLGAFALAGMLAGLAPAVKVQAVVALPILGLYAVWAARPAPRPLLACLAWGAAALAPLAALAAYNAALFGSPLRTGYGASILAGFSAPFWEGFGGQLWGLRRGLIWCSPIVLLAPLGLAAMWRRDRAAALLCAAMALSQVLLYATWVSWDGAGAWGPRFLNTILPFLCLPLAALAAAPLGRRRWLRAAAVALAALTVPVQFGAIGVNMNQLFREPPPASQVLAHLGLAAERAGRAYERRAAPGRLVLLRGLGPSEGQGAALLPRWTLGEATLLARPAGGPATLTLAATSCFVATGPTELTLRLDGALLAAGPACPGRVYRLLLPPGASALSLAAPTWRPADAGIAREGELGVFLSAALLTADGQAQPLVGDRLPADPVPLGLGALRQHLGDPRVAAWDLWWAYLPLTALAPAAVWGIAAPWAALALACVAAGALLLARGGGPHGV